MQKAGIPTVVWLTPILPFINDNADNINGILNYCKEAKVKGILTFGIGMTLRYGNREYFYDKLTQHFPELKREYIKRYGSSYGIKSPANARLSRLIKDFCAQNKMLYGEQSIFSYINDLPQDITQLTMF